MPEMPETTDPDAFDPIEVTNQVVNGWIGEAMGLPVTLTASKLAFRIIAALRQAHAAGKNEQLTHLTRIEQRDTRTIFFADGWAYRVQVEKEGGIEDENRRRWEHEPDPDPPGDDGDDDLDWEDE